MFFGGGAALFERGFVLNRVVQVVVRVVDIASRGASPFAVGLEEKVFSNCVAVENLLQNKPWAHRSPLELPFACQGHSRTVSLEELLSVR